MFTERTLTRRPEFSKCMVRGAFSISANLPHQDMYDNGFKEITGLDISDARKPAEACGSLGDEQQETKCYA